VNPDNGTLKWHFQFTPHDTHDWDANQVPVLADVTVDGRPRKVVIQANRNGFLYVLDRTDGSFITASAFGNQNWASGIAPNGKPIELPGHTPTEEGTITCPDLYGNTNFMPPAFDKSRNLFFVTVRETCARFVRRATPSINVGDRTLGGTVQPLQDPPRTGALRAIDPLTGQRKWEVKYEGPGWAGVVSTEGGLVFSADHAGRFMAVDASSGKVLYSYQTGAPVFAPPTTFMVDTRQYVVMPAGMTLTAFALPATTRSTSSR
jgi:alcohol dehydrogenase (cytochrome c)